MSKAIKLIISVVSCLAIGNLGTLFTVPNIATWYATLTKPSFNPPNWIFAPVWTTLFILMGISLFLIWNSQKKDKNRKVFFVVFIINLILNVLWSLIFFGLHMTGLAFLEVILLALSIIILMVLSWKISKTAAFLLAPYLLWVCFASFLNYNLWILNSGSIFTK
ncbi:MAG: TspO/MBR family protein [Patescibacteria group bacterium]|jgi:tryptophan-rich sensory protein